MACTHVESKIVGGGINASSTRGIPTAHSSVRVKVVEASVEGECAINFE